VTFNEPVVAGTGILDVIDGGDFTTVVASFDITNSNDVTINGNTVTFSAFPAVGGKSYGINAPVGLVKAADDGANGPSFDINGASGVFWFFEIVAPDTTAPAIQSFSPQNGSGASVSRTLSVTYDENVTLGADPWSIEVFDITANQVLRSFSQTDTAGVSTLGTRLSIALSSDLTFNNQYRVTASAGVVKDAAGNLSAAIASGAWQFTTGSAFAASQVVISQVYGGGGNADAPFRNDFVELHNRSASIISLEGWSVQYASSGSVFSNVTLLSGSIQPGGYYLVQQAAGNSTTAPLLPTPDATGTIAMSGTNGKIALSNTSAAFGVANPSGDPSLSDLVGYGSANAFEGALAVPVLSNTTAAIRKVAGSQDTNNNAADFTRGSPAPRNSSSPPFIPGAEGSGIAVVSNATAGAGSLVGSRIFPSMGTAQSVKIDLTGSFAGATLSKVEIDVPADFGAPVSGNVVLSGIAAGSGTAVASGQTITVSGVAVTETAPLSIVISGLAAPNLATDPNDSGNRVFTIRTASSSGTPTAVVTQPSVRVAMTLTDLATLRAITPGGPKAYILANPTIVTYLAEGAFRNQHWIQDSTGGILIDDQSVTLGRAFAVGDGLVNLVGTISEFRGLLQFSPIAATASVSTTGNTPAPIELTLAQLAAAPLTYQSRLVKVTGVTFNPATGNFASNSEHILTQGSDTFGFSSFFGADYTTTPVPTNSVNIVGIVRRLSTTPTDFLSPRSLADITSNVAPPSPTYQDFATALAGGQGSLLDFDNDGVRNGLEYLFGVTAAGFTPTPQIVNGAITWPRDPARTDVGFLVQTSGNLVIWNDVLVGDLDLTDPNSIRYVVPGGTGPFFVRIGATFAPAP